MSLHGVIHVIIDIIIVTYFFIKKVRGMSNLY